MEIFNVIEMFPVNRFIAIFHCDKVVCHDHHAYTNTIKKFFISFIGRQHMQSTIHMWTLEESLKA